MVEKLKRLELFPKERKQWEIEAGVEAGEYGQIIPENPDAIPIHMPSYALMWKLGGGVSNAGGFAQIPNAWKKRLPFIDERSLINNDPEKFSQSVYDDLASGRLVAYVAPHWSGLTDEETKATRGGQYKWQSSWTKEELQAQGRESEITEVDTLFWLKDTDQWYSNVGPHEPMHRREQGTTDPILSHDSHFLGADYQTDQSDFQEQVKMMNATAALLLDRDCRKNMGNWRSTKEGEFSMPCAQTGIELVERLWGALGRGKDITEEFEGLFEDQTYRGSKKKYTWQEIVVEEAKFKLEHNLTYYSDSKLYWDYQQEFPKKNFDEEITESEKKTLEMIIERYDERKGLVKGALDKALDMLGKVF